MLYSELSSFIPQQQCYCSPAQTIASALTTNSQPLQYLPTLSYKLVFQLLVYMAVIIQIVKHCLCSRTKRMSDKQRIIYRYRVANADAMRLYSCEDKQLMGMVIQNTVANIRIEQTFQKTKPRKLKTSVVTFEQTIQLNVFDRFGEILETGQQKAGEQAIDESLFGELFRQ